MQYLSVAWLGCMWLTVGLYWLSPRAYRLWVLAGLTLAFLAWISPLSAVLLVCFAATAHVAGNVLKPTLSGVWLASGAMIAVLFSFKWQQRIDTDNLLDTLVIPLGLSYYTFRCIHFLIERYKGHVGPASADQVIGYLFFLPTIVAGPIHRFDDYRRDLMRQRFDPKLLSEGAERIIYGYAKIVILGNWLVGGVFGDFIATVEPADGVLATYLRTVQSGLNLYFQFAGVSDIAIGFARLLGFRVLENFNWPYLQPNIAAFWRSWHISLSRWCREYIYGPVIARTRSPALGAIATMVAIGLWHEISLRFLLWGAYHGIGIAVWQWLQTRKPVPAASVEEGVHDRIRHGVNVVLTVHFVWFGFIILTAPSVEDAIATFGQLFGIS